MNDGLRWVVTQFHLDTRFVDAMPFSYMKPLSGSGSKAMMIYFFSSRRRHTIYWRDWSSDVCSSDLTKFVATFLHSDEGAQAARARCRACGCCEMVEFVFDGKFGVDDSSACSAGEQIGQPVVALRADHDVDGRRAAEDIFA